MNQQEQLTFFKNVLRHDLNDNLLASALRTVASTVIDVARSIDIKPSEQEIAQKINAAINSMQNAINHEINDALNSETANKRKKTPEKGYAARNHYALAVSAIEQPLQGLIAAMEQLVGAN